MKKLYKIFIVVLSVLFLSGCIQIETKVNINKDGTGTIEETVLMSNEMVQMFNEFMTGFASDSAEVEEFNLYKEEDLMKRETELGEGVKFVSGAEYKTENKQGYKVRYSFTDIGKVKIDQSPDSRIPEDTGVETKDKSYVRFTFNKGDVSEIKINMPESKKDEGENNDMDNEDDKDMEMDEDTTQNDDLSQITFLLKDLSFSFVVNINGEITETNADFIQGSEIILLNLNFGELLDMPEKLKELNDIKPNDLKELNELMKNIPGIKIETDDPVIVKFK